MNQYGKVGGSLVAKVEMGFGCGRGRGQRSGGAPKCTWNDRKRFNLVDGQNIEYNTYFRYPHDIYQSMRQEGFDNLNRECEK